MIGEQASVPEVRTSVKRDLDKDLPRSKRDLITLSYPRARMQVCTPEDDVTAVVHHDCYPVERHVALHVQEIIIYTGNYYSHRDATGGGSLGFRV